MLTDLPVVLASSLVFSLADGQFSSRADLLDAPGSSLGRGAQVAGLGEASFLCLWLFRVPVCSAHACAWDLCVCRGLLRCTEQFNLDLLQRLHRSVVQPWQPGLSPCVL